MRIAALAVLAAVLPAASAPRGDIQITTLDRTFSAKSLVIHEVVGELSVEYEDAQGRRNVVRCMDVVDLALAPLAPPAAPAASDVHVTLWTGDVLYGALGNPDGEGVRIKSAVLGDVLCKFEQLSAVRFLSNRAQWPARRPEKLDKDLVVTRTRDERFGSLNSIGQAGVSYRSASFKKDMTVKPEECAAVFLMNPLPTTRLPSVPKTLYAILQFTDGSELQGTILGMKDGMIRFTDLFGEERSVATGHVSGLYFKNGRVLYLSDMAGIAAEENANYITLGKPLPSDLLFPFQRDRNVLGKPLSIRGQEFRKGIGVHSYSRLTFPLEGRFRRFEATAGIDDAAAGGGHVVFEVLGDGRKLFASGPVTGKDAARPVSLPVEGVRQLVLIVDFGENFQLGDYADWALARAVK